MFFPTESTFIAAHLLAKAIKKSVNPESNQGPFDLQSNALPTELLTDTYRAIAYAGTELCRRDASANWIHYVGKDTKSALV